MRTAVLVASALLWCVNAHAQPTSAATPVAEVQLGSTFEVGNSGRPRVVLADALKRDKLARRFRVTWRIDVFDSHIATTALYNRQKRTLTLYQHSSSRQGRGRSQLLFTEVTDKIIFVAAKTPDKGDLSSFGSVLPQLGCRRYQLR